MPPDRRLRAWELRYQSYWFERLLRTQGATVPAAEIADPHFIVGFWRSGTTLLHNLLYAGWETRTPLTWECFNPASFRLRAQPTVNHSATRPMDAGSIATLGPQEDEFALLLLGEPSLYQAFLDPSLLCSPTLQLDEQSQHNFPRWRDFIGHVAAKGPEHLLLKAPNHIFRMAMLKRCFPQARYVWIGRPFDAVLQSNRRMWAAMIERHAVTTPAVAEIDQFLIIVAERYADILETELSANDGGIMWVDYDGLRSQPEVVSRRVAEFLGVPARPREGGDIYSDTRPHASTLGQPTSLSSIMANLADRIDALHARAAVAFA